MNKQVLVNYFDHQAQHRDLWRKRNWYYHRAIQNLCRFVIPEGSSVLEVGSSTGELLNALKPKYGVGVDISPTMVAIAQSKYSQFKWYMGDVEDLSLVDSFDYVVMSDVIGFLDDIEQVFLSLRGVCHERTRLVITYHNYLWEPLLQLAEFLHLKAKQPLQNWLSKQDIENMLYLAGFEVIKKGNKMICPVWIPIVSHVVNKIISNSPLFSRLGLIQYFVARPQSKVTKDYSVSIVIPARNEKGNIENAVMSLPNFGSKQEIIFVEGHSIDGTWEEIQRIKLKYGNRKNICSVIQKGKGKGDAVRLGFQIAQGEILMILDADLTVLPKDLPKFYRALASGSGEFINGSRLVYPLGEESMFFFNIIGNKFFSAMFSWILGQRIKDTLCGTKVLFKNDYEKIAAGRKYFGDFDPFGDFDLLFGAAKLNLKIVEMPIRYRARTYGSTNIQRWKHGWLLFKMTLFAMRKMKFN